MIDIQVNGLVKSFEVGQNILDGITFQIDQGQRVGLLGKNGAGKSTLFKILTGELEYDEGTVTIAPGRRIGLISQIPVYPDGYTVEDVLRLYPLYTDVFEKKYKSWKLGGRSQQLLGKYFISKMFEIRCFP